jgi:CRP-like cAMP-binding protein
MAGRAFDTRSVTLPMLQALPEEERRALLAGCRRRTFARGEVIFHEGDLADSVHMLTSGRVAVYVTTPSGEVATLAVLGPGATFGEVALVAEPPTRSATVAAIERCVTLSIQVSNLEALRQQHPEIDRFLLGLLAAQVRRLTARLLEALYLPADKRVLRRLSDLAAIYGGAAPEVTVPVTQEVLASMAGTSRVTANHALRRAESVGCVELHRGRVLVTDRRTLGRLAR